jgi:hypothetical protein
MRQLSDMVKSALILGIALLVAAFLNGGIYQIVVAGAGSGGSGSSQDQIGEAGSTDFRAFRVNRFTGAVSRIDDNFMFNIRSVEVDWNKKTPAATPSPSD